MACPPPYPSKEFVLIILNTTYYFPLPYHVKNQLTTCYWLSTHYDMTWTLTHDEQCHPSWRPPKHTINRVLAFVYYGGDALRRPTSHSLPKVPLASTHIISSLKNLNQIMQPNIIKNSTCITAHARSKMLASIPTSWLTLPTRGKIGGRARSIILPRWDHRGLNPRPLLSSLAPLFTIIYRGREGGF